ncbi:hypothetical protein E2P81_ATG06191 [Venturia nashicola]|uniref:Uncharacterized protein n=1 Tax=Venturia nashicola TaxID=86259 RepID=A0A4Z1PBA5_9PEZI|nr:hypothetical protein E6O75_ATG06334 [Venturia nashicola]TLD27845.1 hypothetical protein E2P81_ATG06191 [Venturia nashicola]
MGIVVVCVCSENENGSPRVVKKQRRSRLSRVFSGAVRQPSVQFIHSFGVAIGKQKKTITTGKEIDEMKSEEDSG